MTDWSVVDGLIARGQLIETEYQGQRFYMRKLHQRERDDRWSVMREAMLYERLPDSKVRCNLCAHHCVIADGKQASARCARIRAARCTPWSTGAPSPSTWTRWRRSRCFISIPAPPPTPSPRLAATSAAAGARTGRSPRCPASSISSWGEKASPEQIVAAAQKGWLPEHRLHLHRADRLLRVRLRYGPPGPRGWPGQHLRHQRLHDRGDAGDLPALPGCGQRGPEGVPRRNLPQVRRGAAAAGVGQL